jgi:hypothetical protein
MVFPTTKPAEVNYYGADQDEQIGTRKRLMGINHPRVNQSCER